YIGRFDSVLCVEQSHYMSILSVEIYHYCSDLNNIYHHFELDFSTYCIESYAMSYLFQESSLSHLRSKYHKCDSYCSALHEHSNVMSFFLDSSHLIGHKNYGHMLENCDTYLFVAIDSSGYLVLLRVCVHNSYT